MYWILVVLPLQHNRGRCGERVQLSADSWLVNSCSSLGGGLFGSVFRLCCCCHGANIWKSNLKTIPKTKVDIDNSLRKNGRLYETLPAAARKTDTGSDVENNVGQMGPFDCGAEAVHGFYWTEMGVHGKTVGHLRGMWVSVLHIIWCVS